MLGEVGLFDVLFGKGRAAAAARKAEANGDLARAAELWMEAERPEDAARVMVIRGDAEPDAAARLRHYTHAAALAPEGGALRRTARTKRAELVVAMTEDAAVSAVARRDLLGAAADLEELGEAANAAAAYRAAGDKDGEARALAKAGDVDRLEVLLASQQEGERAARMMSEAQADIEMLVTSGKRREALAAAERLLREQPDKLRARERVSSLRAQRAMGPVANMIVSGKRMALALGDEIVIGRTDGTLRVPSHSVSRRHVRIRRENGQIVMQDLESRNGTQLRGMNVLGALPIGEGLDLRLGKEVPLRIAPFKGIDGAISIDLAGATTIAPLGPARLGIGEWRIELASDDWLELVSGQPPAFAGDVAVAPRTTLFVSDALARERGGPVVLEVLG
jgi:hypothetical protein